MATPIYSFGEFQLDLAQFALTRNGLSVRLEKKPLELLGLFASSDGRLVTRAEIAERLWGSDVFVDTEHGINTAVRKIRAALEDNPEAPRFVQTVPGVGYRFVAEVMVADEKKPEEVRSVPEAILAAEPDQATPHQVALSHAAPAPKTRPRWLIPALMSCGIVLLAAIAVLVGRGVLARRAAAFGSGTPIRSVAILPLANYSGDPKLEYLADGMTDELITMLVRDSTLRVPSRTTVMQYKAVKGPMAQIAKDLGADAIVEGSVSRSATEVHLNLQLIRADSDSHLWAESYDRSLDQAAALPDEAAREIAARLESAAPSPGAVGSVSPEAHEAYLRGMYLWPTERMEESGAYFKKATELQPDYAEAWAGLASYYGAGVASSSVDPRVDISLLEEAAERAVSLDPNLAVAHQSLGAADLIGRWDLAGADRETLLSLRLNPNDALTYYVRSDVLAAMKRTPEAIEAAKKTMELNPFEIRTALADAYVEARRLDDALTELKLRMETAPTDPGILFVTAEVWQRKGGYKEAMEAWAKVYRVTGDANAAAGIRRAFDAGGAHGMVRWQLHRRLEEGKKEYVSPVELASSYAQLGDKEHAIALLEEAYEQRSTDFLWIESVPAFDWLNGDARYQALLKKLPRG